MGRVHLARMAMATRFELVLEGDDEVWLRAAGEDALNEIGRLEAQLSLFRPSSEISRINAFAAREPIRVEPQLFGLLKTAKRIHRETGGAFDITVAPLMRAWGFFRDSGRLPDPAVLEAAREVTGMDLVELDEDARTVRFAREGVMLDLGAIGKGYAVDEAIQLLHEAGVGAAFLHGGTSTISAFGKPEDADAWNVAISRPPPVESGEDQVAETEPQSGENVLAVAAIENASLSVSAVWGKAFQAGGRTFGHVLDPRRAEPVEGALLAAVLLPSATVADALSTALLVLGRQSVEVAAALPDQPKWMVLLPADTEQSFEVLEDGLPLLRLQRGR